MTVTKVPLKYRVLISVIFGIFMVILDGTVVNVAFQTLRTEFGASLNDSQWIISVYVLALGISTPLSGFLANRFGYKVIYLTGLFIFILGSFLCGISPNLTFMIVARIIQGIGGGIALPLGTAFLFRTFPAEEQGKALGIFGIASLVAPALGPILGGLLVDHGLWREIFFINPPIGLLGVVLGSLFLPNIKGDHQPAIDYLGLITESIGFGAILYAASLAANNGWASDGVFPWFAVGLVGLVAFAVVELFVAKEPLLDLRLFKEKIFLNASLLGYVSVIALFGAEFLMPIYLQSLRGMTAFDTGLILVPMAITGGIATIVAGRLYDKVGPRVLVGFGFAILIVNTWQLAQIKADTPIAWIIALLVLRGLALGSTVQTTFVTALSVVPLKQVAIGSSLTNATRQVVQAIGVAILASVLASTLSPSIAALQTRFEEMPVQPGAPVIGVCDVTPSLLKANMSMLASIIGSPSASLARVDPPGQASLPQSLTSSPDQSSSQPLATMTQLLTQTCQENVAGFERAYTVTFFAAILALILGLMLPGWPFKWGGRRAADRIPSGH